MTTLAENMIVTRADNHPPILEKSIGWHHRLRTYEELIDKEKIRDECDIRASNIVLQGLPSDVYNLVSHHTVAKEIWDIVKLLMEGTKLSLQERNCKLYNEFDRFTSVNGETIHEYYLIFAPLINDMNKTGMFMQKLQVNKKFVNKLQPEWSKFVTDVKLARDMHESNFDQLYAYLRKHESNATSTGVYRNVGNNAANQTRVIRCYNCRGKGHMARQCTQPKRPRNADWFKEKILLVHTHESWVVLDAKQLAFLADLGISKGQDTQTSLPINVAFQTDDHDAFDLNCDEAPFARAVLMANLSSYDSDVLLNVFDKGLHTRINEMKAVFNQMDSKVEQCSVDKKCVEIQKKELFLENDRLLELIISQDLLHTTVNSYAAIIDYKSMEKSYIEECSRLENRCTSLEIKVQQSKESFQNNRPSNNQDTPESHEFFMINELKAQLKAKESSIIKLKTHIATLKGKCMSDSNVSMNNGNVIAPGMFSKKLVDVTPMNKNKKVRFQEPRVISSTNASGSTPKKKGDTKKNRITQAASSNQKNNTVEDHPRNVQSSSNKKNHVFMHNASRTDRPLVLGLGLLQAHDQTALSAHQFCKQVFGKSDLVMIKLQRLWVR
ncbi:retrovirus-related pol polyprotein from transposon TNT 1-94 [Tanacetum coccineum]|uniref:Retrovirus-related pol polyprotein from transposon TNT 1-94 n=1 Tax=Tanacetum coccineum TaxID=301880 RepID=A0ABQ5GLX5_9ASTR